MKGPKEPCRICGSEADQAGDDATPSLRCPRCGSYQYPAYAEWPKLGGDHMVWLSGWVREQNAAGVEFPNITPDLARTVAHRPLPGLQERSDRVLALLAREFSRPELWFVPDAKVRSPELQAISYCRDTREALLLVHILEDQGYLRGGTNGMSMTIKGILAAEALGKSVSSSAQCFVAMSFDDSMMETYTRGFHPGIEAAGYRAFRIDSKEYVGGISDEMIAEIRRSQFMVADYTFQRSNVYFEAGFALGLGLLVIPTCRDDEAEALHFDIRHLNALRWATPDDLMNKLSKRIRAVLGAGPYVRDEAT